MIHTPRSVALVPAAGEGIRLHPLAAGHCVPDLVEGGLLLATAPLAAVLPPGCFHPPQDRRAGELEHTGEAIAVFDVRGAEAALRRALHRDARTHVGRLGGPARP